MNKREFYTVTVNLPIEECSIFESKIDASKVTVLSWQNSRTSTQRQSKKYKLRTERIQDLCYLFKEFGELLVYQTKNVSPR